jgi:hypothetical protein
MLENYLGQTNEVSNIIDSAVQELMRPLSHAAPLGKARNKPLMTP